MLDEIRGEAIRLDHSLSWMVQQAWRIALEKVRTFPSANQLGGGADDPRGRNE